MTIIVILLSLVCTGLLAVVIVQRRQYRRLQKDADGIVLRYLAVTERFESLVRDLTEPYGGVLSALNDVEQLDGWFAGKPESDNRMTARQALMRIDCRLRILLRKVADRYPLSETDRQRWLNVDGGSVR
ncbi:hypothetical protein [Pantoea agglomerans]|uniref:hypothetical protein n=1 Tax=Enterobacter agglomerans TaxID=549 RepID=UPI0024134B05|nr:hypothetical protein [Pantoea agglomerans]